MIALINFIKNFFVPKAVLPVPAKYPGRHNISQWMEQKATYFAYEKPDLLYLLFCPSTGDYLPLSVTAGVSREAFLEHLESYNKIKKQYPEAVAIAKGYITPWHIFNGGPSADY